MSQMIKVINHNPETLKGRYDGHDYVFKTDKPVELSLEAASHIFGLGNDDKSQALNMLGLLIPGRHTLEDGLAKLDRITFLEGRYVYEEGETPPDEQPGDEDGGAPTPERRSRRTGGRPHVAGPGGEQVAGGQPPAAANPA